MPKLTSRPEGNFSFLADSRIFCTGAVADKDHTMAHATFKAPIPLARGFAAIADYMQAIGRPMTAVAGLELRINKPLSFDGFRALSATYIKLLDKYGLRVGEHATTTRTNVAIEPIALAPKTPSIYGFTFTIPGARDGNRAGFVGSGIGELDGGTRDKIVQLGKTSPKAMRIKAEWVMNAVKAQMGSLGVKWNDVSHTNLYTVRSVDSYFGDVIVATMGAPSRYGVNWLYSRPPIEEIEVEVDVRGTAAARSDAP
jgi:hypothetical protein